MANGLSATAEERILLYLLNFGCQEDAFECDSGLTQKGISVNVKIQRKHISRNLDRLVRDGLVSEGVKHVKGAKQKMRCYWLTAAGLQTARELQAGLGKTVVNVKVGAEIREMRLADIDSATSIHLRFSDIVCEALESEGVLDMKVLEGIEEDNRRMMDERTARAEVYRQALAVAWRSGILTSSEKHLVEALRTHLGITDEEHREMEARVIDEIPADCNVQADIYDEILNILGGDPTEREERILALLKKRLVIYG